MPRPLRVARALAPAVALLLVLSPTFDALPAPSFVGPRLPQTPPEDADEAAALTTQLDLSLDLFPASRPTYPGDVQETWRLLEAPASSSCPAEITHTTWSRLSGPSSEIFLPHNTIQHNGDKCSSVGNEKRMLVYERQNYDAELNPIGDAPPMPDDLLLMLRSTGPNINALFAAEAQNENYMVGWESRIRVCPKDEAFRAGTTAFFLRPFGGAYRINKVDTEIQVGNKYMLLIPTYEGITCVYAKFLQTTPEPQPDPSPDDLEPSPSPDGDGSGDGNGAGDGDGGDGTGGGVGPGHGNGIGGGPSVIPTPSPALPEGTPEESLPPVESPPVEEDNSVCFPASATVSLSDGRTLTMSELSVGDRVAVSNNAFSPVFGFSHQSHTALARFIELRFSSGHVLRATPSHFVYAGGMAKPMRAVLVGEAMLLADGRDTTVVAKRDVVDVGLYNPQTQHGDLVVDGLRVTTYTTAVEPRFAHAALAPLRALFRVARVDALAAVLDGGVRALVHHVPSAVAAAM